MSIKDIDSIAKEAHRKLRDFSGETWNKHIDYINLYPIQDYRTSYWKNISTMIFWTVIQLENFYERNIHKKISHYFPKESSVNITNQRQIILQFDRINKQSYITGMMSKTETFLATIASELKINTKSFGYKSLVYALSNELFNSPKDGDYLYAPYIIRNSLHNNGINLTSNLEITIKGKKFRFEKDKKIINSSWMDLILLSNKLLQTVQKILDCQKVVEIRYIPHTLSESLDVLHLIREE